MSTGRFLAWTALSCAVGAGLSSWLAAGSSNGVRVAAALIGLGVGLLVVFLAAWAMPAATAPPAAVAPVATETAVTEPPPPPPDPQPDLAARLEEGRALDPQPDGVDDWIAATTRSLAEHRPGVLGYFAALQSRTFPDERARLDAHLARLETIVRS